jgi:hypothetical protein
MYIWNQWRIWLGVGEYLGEKMGKPYLFEIV